MRPRSPATRHPPIPTSVPHYIHRGELGGAWGDVAAQVRVQAGARVQDVVERLRPHGLTLQNYASIREQSIGGFVQVRLPPEYPKPYIMYHLCLLLLRGGAKGGRRSKGGGEGGV